MKLTTAIATGLVLASATCQAGMFDIQQGDNSARTPVTGSAGHSALTRA